MKKSIIAAALCGFATISVAAPSWAHSTTASSTTSSSTKPACCQLHETKVASSGKVALTTVAAKAAPGKSGASKSGKAAPKKKTPAQLREEKLDSLWKQSDKAFHDGNYPLAVSFHRKIVAIDPTDTEAYSNGAWLLWSMGKGNDALAFLQRGIKANPKNADMWEAVGNHYGTFLKRHRDAQVAYARAIQYSPRGANTQMLRRRLAHAAEGAGDLQTSLATWRALVRDYPNISVNRNNLARVEKLMKRGSVSA
ncbi:MAG TPA: tetratricopeptide repeat protein [Abditibacteriaceae bacterium]|jgi:tetratricopeptide (TPR) repeat protein